LLGVTGVDKHEKLTTLLSVLEPVQNQTGGVNRGATGLALGAVLYASVWLAVFGLGSGSPVTFYVWVASGGIAMGGLAGFALGREGLVTPLSVAILVLLLGLLPTGGVDGGASSPGMYSLAFLFGWPLFFVLAGLLALLERSVSDWSLSPL